MKSGLFVLPFLALFVGALATAVGSAFSEVPWITYAGWGCSAAIIGLWVSLDFEGFRRMFTRKGAKYGASSGLTVLLGILVIVGLAFLTNKPRFNKSYDATKSQVNTLSEQSVKILETMKEKNQTAEVVAFFQDEDQKQKFADLVANYSRIADVLKITYYNPQVNPTEAKALNITSANTVIMKTPTQEARVTQFTEEKITNALVKILKESAKKIYFTKGHGEPQLRDQDAQAYSVIVTELENNRYEVAELSLLESSKVPDDTNLLVISGLKYDLQPQEATMVEDYLKRGGALFVAVDAMNSVPNLAGLLQKAGIVLNNDFLILRPDDPRSRLIGQNNAIVSKFDEFSPVTKDFAAKTNTALLVPNARSMSVLETNDLSLKPTLVGKTAEVIIKVKNVNTQADLKGIDDSRIEEGEFGVIAVASGKAPGVQVAKNDATPDAAKPDAAHSGVAGEGGKEIRVVAVGSSQLASNMGAQRAEHRDVVMNIVNYLLQDEDFISIRPRDSEKGSIDVSSPTSQLSLVFFSLIYPFIFLGGGLVYWLKRRKA